MIPKKIHYCWFGGKPLPDEALRCIASWRRYCPDYQIIEWNEHNYDVHKTPYSSEAYCAKQYAFVSDYARLDIIYQHGGIYLDTDVELIKGIDCLLDHQCYLGCQLEGEVNTGIGFGAVKGHWFIEKNRQVYRAMRFLMKNGKYNKTLCVTITTDLLKEHGLTSSNSIQQIRDVVIYPPPYFCPVDVMTRKLTLTDCSLSIHHFHGSWHGENGQLRKIVKSFTPLKIRLRRLIDKLFGDGSYSELKKMIKGHK